MKKSELTNLIKECIKESGLAPYSMSGGINPEDYDSPTQQDTWPEFPISKARMKQLKGPDGKIDWKKLTTNEKKLLDAYREEKRKLPINKELSSIFDKIDKKNEKKKNVRDKFMAYREKNKPLSQSSLSEGKYDKYSYFIAVIDGKIDFSFESDRILGTSFSHRELANAVKKLLNNQSFVKTIKDKMPKKIELVYGVYEGNKFEPFMEDGEYINITGDIYSSIFEKKILAVTGL